MKKEYKALEMETVRFDAEDIITASGGCPKDEELICDCDYIEYCECDGGVYEPCQDTAKYLKR